MQNEQCHLADRSGSQAGTARSNALSGAGADLRLALGQAVSWPGIGVCPGKLAIRRVRAESEGAAGECDGQDRCGYTGGVAGGPGIRCRAGAPLGGTAGDRPDPRASARPARCGLRGHPRSLPPMQPGLQPCYHSRDANQVRVDGPHTLAEVRAQMRLLRDRPPPRLARPGPHRPPPAALPAPRDRPGPAMAGLLARHPSYLRRGAGPRAPVHPAGGRHPSARCRRHHGPRRGTPALATAQPR